MAKTIEIKPGLKYRGSDGDLWHVVALFEDNGRPLVVVKSWSKFRNKWIYEVETKEILEWWLKRLSIKSVNTKKEK